MRTFLRLGNKNAGYLKRLPSAIEKSDSINAQMESYWLPAFEVCFGSIEYFIFCFAKTAEGRASLETLVSEGRLDDVIKERMNGFIKPAIQGWRETLQHDINSKAVEIYKGAQLSEQYVLSHCK